MAKIGKTDVFEREYLEKFRAILAKHGEFISYERDRGARDLGFHFSKKNADGSESMSSSLCWFQHKGIMRSTMTEEQFNKAEEIKIRLSVNHLRYWYLQPVTTYLIVFVESVNRFLVTDLHNVIHETYGRDILTKTEASAEVVISKQSVFDEQAIRIILKRGTLKEWAKAIEVVDDRLQFCVRDYHLIWHIGTAKQRSVEHRLRMVDWQSKMRGEVYVDERKTEEDLDWQTIWEHWQYGLSFHDVESCYRFVELYARDEDDFDDFWDDDGRIEVTVANGDLIAAEDNGEYAPFRMRNQAK